MQNVLIILDFGHGVDTPGKRSPSSLAGAQLYEWQFTRLMGNKFIQRLHDNGMDYVITNHYPADLDIHERAAVANKQYNMNKADFDIIFGISFHGNAFYNERVNGSEVYTYPGYTSADDLAEFIALEWKNDKATMFRPDMGDGDLDKEAKFVILRDTIMPFVLLEFGYYTNEMEKRNLLDNDWQERMIESLWIGVKKYINLRLTTV